MKRIILFFTVCLGLSISGTTFADNEDAVRAAAKRTQNQTVSATTNSATANRSVVANARKTENVQNKNARGTTKTQNQKVVSRTQQKNQNVKPRTTVQQPQKQTETPSVTRRSVAPSPRSNSTSSMASSMSDGMSE